MRDCRRFVDEFLGTRLVEQIASLIPGKRIEGIADIHGS
jgi:hypothetical protein